MGKITSFKDLIVWQKSHKLVLEIYQITKTFPEDEKFGLISQIRRSSASVPTNIVEGYKRTSKKELLYFLNVSEASLEELKYQLILSYDLGYILENKFNILIGKSDEVGRLLYGFKKSLT